MLRDNVTWRRTNPCIFEIIITDQSNQILKIWHKHKIHLQIESDCRPGAGRFNFIILVIYPLGSWKKHRTAKFSATTATISAYLSVFACGQKQPGVTEELLI
jgi:hypothetical protein